MSAPSTRATVLGTGSWGTTFAAVLADAGREVTLWGRRAAVCEQITTEHRNEEYLPGLRLPDSIRVTVRNAHLALEGVVDWYCQRDAAEAAVRPLRGARGVTNHIRVREELPPEGITELVESPLLSV